MTLVFRDDYPPEYGLGRRQLLTGSAAFAALIATQAGATAAAIPTPKFMEISSLLVNHDLNLEVGSRLAAGMGILFPDTEAHIDEILAIAKTKNAKIVEDFYPDIPPGPLQSTALAGTAPMPISSTIPRSPPLRAMCFNNTAGRKPSPPMMSRWYARADPARLFFCSRASALGRAFWLLYCLG